MNRSEVLDEWSVETDFWGLEIQDGVENVRVEAETHNGRPYVSIEVRLNEYGLVSESPKSDDPVSNTIQKHGLDITGIRPTTESTSRAEIICCDPDDGVEVQD